MIIDVTAWTGSWNTLDVRGDVDSVRMALRAFGVERICLSPLNAAWRPNPHLDNRDVYAAADRYGDITPVPILDPTLPTWTHELAIATGRPDTPMARILPGYGGYGLDATDAFCAALSLAGIALAVQVRIDDPRHQHPLAQVPDVPVEKIVGLARRHPYLRVIIAGPTTAAIRHHRDSLLTLPNLYADVSQADGLDAIKSLVETGLASKLLFGSHAPLFVPAAAVARVVNDLTDASAVAILSENARRLLRLPAKIRKSPN